MKSMKWVGILILAMASSAMAQEQTRGYLSGGQSGMMKGWSPYIELGSGYMGHVSEVNVEGMPSTAKILGSYTTDSGKYVFDGGLGVENQTFAQGTATETNMNTTVLELAARYQWDNRVQAGVVYNTLFNKGDDYGSNQADVQFIGLQALKEISLSPEWQARLGARYMTDINIDGSWTNLYMIDVAFGYNPAYRTANVRDTAAYYRVNERPLLAEKGRKTMKDYTTDDFLVRQDLFLFSKNSSDLKPVDQRRLEKLAAALQDKPDLVQKIEVVGFSDPNSSNETNPDLAKERADAVKDSLTAKGLSSDKMEIVAMGDTENHMIGKPAEMNRRAEIHFVGVKDKKELAKVIKSIE